MSWRMPVVLYLECLKILRLSQPLNGKEHDEELSFVLSFFLRHRHFTLLKATVLRLAFFFSHFIILVYRTIERFATRVIRVIGFI